MKKISCINGICEDNSLALYTLGDSSLSNDFCVCAAVKKNGKIESVGIGMTKIPKGGFVLSGRGSEAEWISQNLAAGDKIKISNNCVFAPKIDKKRKK